MGAEQRRLQSHHARVPRRDVRDRLDPALPLDRDRGHQRVHAGARHRVVVDVEDVDLARGGERARDVEHALGVAATRRIELDRDDELVRTQHALELRLLRLDGPGDARLARAHDDRRAGLAVLDDRLANRGDLGRRRPAAAADQACAEAVGVRCEVGEVVGRRVRVDDPAGRDRRQADVRKRGERRARPAPSPRARAAPPGGRRRGSRRSRRGRAGGAVPPRRRRRHRRSSPRPGRRRGARRSGATTTDADRVERDEQLVEVVEGLDHEQVDAASLEQLRLFREEPSPVFAPVGVAERADRAADVDVAARDLARLARQLDGRAVDRGQVVLEEVGAQLAPVGAEAVRLDQVGAGADEAEMQRDHALRSAQVRLLGRPEAGHRRGEQDARAAVADQRRPGAQAICEPRGHGGRA